MEEFTKILEATELLFRKYGIRSVSMSDIAAALGMSKKTLYQFIDNKNELIEKIMLSYISSEKENTHSITQNAKNALDEMMKISFHVQKNLENLNPVLLFDLKKYHFDIWKHFNEYHFDYIQKLIARNLEKGKEEGIYRNDINAEIISRIHVSTIEIFADDSLLPPDKFPRIAIHKEFVMYHLHGILSDKGRTLFYEYQNQA